MSDGNNTQGTAGMQGGTGKNRRFLYIAVAVVVIVVAAFLIYNASGGNSGSLTNLTKYDNLPVPASLMQELNVSNNVSNAVGIGEAITSNIQLINGTKTLVNGKPLLLYIGAEYCPYCGFQRWAMIVALQRFGTFTGVSYMTSSSKDIDPNTPTYSFYGSSYSSSYITFVPVELTTNKEISADTYQPLQYPNASENATLAKFDSSGGIPFLFFGNETVIDGVLYNNPGILNSNWSVIAKQIQNSSTLQSQAVVGAANLITVQICQMDNNQPSKVCTQPYVTTIEKDLG
jgi:hypothetical protein